MVLLAFGLASLAAAKDLSGARTVSALSQPGYVAKTGTQPSQPSDRSFGLANDSGASLTFDRTFAPAASTGIGVVNLGANVSTATGHCPSCAFQGIGIFGR